MPKSSTSAGTRPKSDCQLIALPWSVNSLRTVLRWGAGIDPSPHTHQEIAHWCDRFWVAHLESDVPPDLERALQIAGDVDCQWDLYLANSYPLEELGTLDLRDVSLPADWFVDWLRELGAV